MIRWITEHLGTAAFTDPAIGKNHFVLDVRDLVDKQGNSPTATRKKIDQGVALLQQGQRLVICCDHGISRSNAMAAAILAGYAGLSFNESLLHVIKATGETGIKIDFVEDLRRALNVDHFNPKNPKAFILGLDGFVGRSLGEFTDPALFRADIDQDPILLESPVLLDEAMDRSATDRIIFCWHPPSLDTNIAIGRLLAALRNALEVCRIRKVGLIFLSGHQVFAGSKFHGNESFCEADEPLPSGAAGDGLFLGEILVKQYGARYKLPMLIVRPTHVYGPRDERPWLLNTIIQKAFMNQEIITHRYQNGAPLIDLIHVHDLVRALKAAIKKNLTGILHISSNNPISTRDLAELVVRKAGSASKVLSVEMPGEYKSTRLESGISSAISEWMPSIDLEIGLNEIFSCRRQSLS